MLAQITATVSTCEDDARIKTGLGVGFIAQKGLSSLGGTWEAPIFRPEKMFKSKSHALVRQVDTQIEVWDFFDVAGHVGAAGKSRGDVDGIGRLRVYLVVGRWEDTGGWMVRWEQ